MGKFITLREEFESETGSIDDKSYIEWLEKVVEKKRILRVRIYDLIKNQKDIDPEISRVLNDKFHDLF
jgi:hypothetical protein